jgi:hypothetical protein
LKSRGNMLLLIRCDAVEEGQRESPAGDGFGNGERGRGGAGVRMPGGLEVNGSEVTSCGNAASGEESANAVQVCALRQANYIDKPGDCAVWKCNRRQFEIGDCRQERLVALSDGSAAGEYFVDSRQLDAAEGACEIGEAVVVAGFNVVQPVARLTSALVAEAAETGGVGWIVGQDGAAFAGGELLVGIEAEDS